MCAGDPKVTQDALVIRDWGQFQSPGSGWEECPYRRATSGAAVLRSQGQGFNKTRNPMIIGILDQSLATWYNSACSASTNSFRWHGMTPQALVD